MEKHYTDVFIDVFQLTSLGLEEAGETPLQYFARIADSVQTQTQTQDASRHGVAADAASVVRWSVRGRQTPAGERFLQVDAQADVQLECQRCLSFFTKTINVSNVVQVVGSEAALEDSQDLDPEATERIVGSQRLDVLALIEDELILSLPYVPMHDVCPSLPGSFASAEDPDADAVRLSPFAALGKLKKD